MTGNNLILHKVLDLSDLTNIGDDYMSTLTR